MDDLKKEFRNEGDTKNSAGKGRLKRKKGVPISAVDDEAIFQELKKYLSEVLGEDVLDFIEVKRESSFIKDLEMDSIQLVAFGELVSDSYGGAVDFAGWLSKIPIHKLLGLKVGDVSAFIAETLAERAQETPDEQN
jgi:acyl carrier protein